MLLPPQYLNAIVSIEEERDGKRLPLATGFLFAYHLMKKDEKGNDLYKIYLVTNRHVFEKKTDFLWLRFNPIEQKPAQYYKLLLCKGNEQLWFGHENPKIDIAIIGIYGQKLIEDGIQYYSFRSNLDVAYASQFKEIGIFTGDDVFILGFPMGIRGDSRNYVIARKGSIARLDEEILNKGVFYIDALIFPGSSGGPVILKPELTSLEGTPSVNTAFLIGMVKGYIPYRDVAVSEQTKKPRIIFEENSGLAAVTPIDYIKEAIEKQEKKIKRRKIKTNYD